MKGVEGCGVTNKMHKRYKVPEECARCSHGPDNEPLVPPDVEIDELLNICLACLCLCGRAECEATDDEERREAGEEDKTGEELEISDTEYDNTTHEDSNPMVIQDIRVDKAEDDGEGGAPSCHNTIHHPQVFLEVKTQNR